MALTGNARLVFCIFFIACCCFTVTLAQIPMDCCLSVTNKTIEKQHIANYRRQSSSSGCPRDAMILVTRRGLNLCVPIDEAWVRDVLTHVDWVRTHCKKTGYKGRRCFGLKPQ